MSVSGLNKALSDECLVELPSYLPHRSVMRSWDYRLTACPIWSEEPAGAVLARDANVRGIVDGGVDVTSLFRRANTRLRLERVRCCVSR